MILILIFAAANIVISRHLERRKWSLATVLHASAFTLLLAVLLLMQSDPLISGAAKWLLGERAVRSIHLYLQTENGMAATLFILQIVIIEMATLLPLVICGPGVEAKVIRCLHSTFERRYTIAASARRVAPRVEVLFRPLGSSILRRKCVMLC